MKKAYDYSNDDDISDFNIIKKIIQILDSLPLPPKLKKLLKRDLEFLIELLTQKRPPRFLIAGRRGSGKSSIINAIFKKKVADVGSVFSKTGKAEWYQYKSENGTLEIIDTRGFGDTTNPATAEFDRAIEDLFSSIEDNIPDIIVFLCKAKEIDSHFDKDIDMLSVIIRNIYDQHGFRIPIIGLVTQVDELDPLQNVDPPYHNKTKQKNIELSVDHFSSMLEKKGIEYTRILPISAYAEFENDRIVYERFWNIDVLIDFMAKDIPSSGQIEFVRLSQSKKVQERLAKKVVNSMSTLCSAIAAVPIPIPDIIPITSLQITMIIVIGYISGRKLSKESAVEFITAMGVNVGAGAIFKEGARALIKLVPIYGSIVSATVAGLATKALGNAAISYFIFNRPIDEVKRVFYSYMNLKNNSADEV